MKNSNPPYLLSHNDIEAFLKKHLEHLFMQELFVDKGESLSVKLTCPNDAEANFCMNSNYTLYAMLEVIWSAHPKTLKLKIPYPLSGVFIIRSATSQNNKAGKWVWHPRLTGQCGGRKLIHHSYKQGEHSTKTTYRVDFPCLKYIEIQFDSASSTPSNKFRLPNGNYLLPFWNSGSDIHGDNLFFEKLKNEFPYSIVPVSKRSYKQRAQIVKKHLTDVITSGTDVGLDEQDLSWQRLYTYSAHLIETFFERVVIHSYRYFYGIKNKSKAGTVASKQKAQDLWNFLLKMDECLIGISNLIQTGWLHSFSPINKIEALSKLMSFQRYNYKKDVLERLPAVFRQSHPSFQRIVCPVESPESLKVGITLHLARGVKTDILGKIVLDESNDDDGLGYAASLVPFYQYNDGARAMMGAKNLKQAVIIDGAESPKIKTGYENTVTEAISDLVKNQILNEEFKRELGVDLLVAYMPWYGWNMEDAIVANSRLADQGILDWKIEESFFKWLKPGVELVEPVFENKFEEAFKSIFYDEQGLRKPGWIQPHNPVAFLKDIESQKVVPINCLTKVSGDLVEMIYYPPSSKLFGGSLAWKICKYSKLKVGDKIMGRYGNKGVISKIIPSEAMPCFPVDKRLPKELQGRAVDLLLNPHGVISRMNLGQLLETTTGLEQRIKRDRTGNQEIISKAFSRFNTNSLRKTFQELNKNDDSPLFDENGRLQLILPNGEKIKAPVTVGFQHMVRLKHTAENKCQVRGGAGAKGKSYLYNLVTGQPVGGRRRRGGQRLGEMEIWALAAYQANKMLQGVLGCKSDPGYPSKKIPHGQTFQSVIDHLFAMGIDFKSGKLCWTSPETIEKRGKQVLKPVTWEVGAEGICYCGKTDCGYRINGTILVTGKTARAGKSNAKVDDLLASQGFRFSLSPDKGVPPYPGKAIEGEISVSIEPLQKEKRKKRISISYKRLKRSIQINFHLGRNEYFAYKQNDTAEKPISIATIGQLWITCPTHKTQLLDFEALKPVPIGVREGLCDEKIFGDLDLKDWNPDSWGYIKLPKGMSYPGKEVSDKRLLKQSLLKFSKTDNPPEIRFIPVLPLKYRYRGVSKSSSSSLPQNDVLTEKYLKIARLSTEKFNEYTQEKIRKTVGEIFKLIYDRLSGKLGMLRRNGLGRRVDMSGRLVIVPDPDMAWDECGIPPGILMQFLGGDIVKEPHILDEFMKNEAVDRLIKALFNEDRSFEGVDQEIEEMILNKNFWLNSVWPDKRLNDDHLEAVKIVLERYLEEHPGLTLVLNRQPSLHRYSMMGFRPIVLPPEEGLVLKINPLVCKGFGADFDGDEMAVHMPLGSDEQNEADNMKPTKQWNLFSYANNQILANFDQDFVAGHFYISMDSNARKSLKCVFKPLVCDQCLEILEEQGVWRKKHGERLLTHLCHKHPHEAPGIVTEWMQLAFKQVTEEGLSFGILELEILKDLLDNETNAFIRECENETNAVILSDKTTGLGDKVLNKLYKIIQGPSDAPGFGLAALAVSGARGTKQVRQLIGSRGYLDPGHTGFNKNTNDYFIKESLVGGMTSASSFMASMNSRSSMLDKKLGTGRAGHLTRQLVLAGWNWVVTKGDCGADRTGGVMLADCRWKEKQTICSSCYGKLPGLASVPKGFPAGLVAAQSFGERGTQLSMQSFHTAEKQLSIDEVVSLLDGKDPVPGYEKKAPYNWFLDEIDATLFVERIKRENGYKNIEDRHIQLIWLIIYMSEKKSLSSAWQSTCSPLSSLIGPGQWKALLAAIKNNKNEEFLSPFVKVMMSQSPVVVER